MLSRSGPSLLQAESANVAFEKLQKVAKSKVVELSPAEAEKETGNSLFKKGDYSKVGL